MNKEQNTENKDLTATFGNTMLGEEVLNFRNDKKPEDFKLVVIKYRYRKNDGSHPKYEIGSAYYHKGWWVCFYNPYTFSDEYEVIGWADYHFA